MKAFLLLLVSLSLTVCDLLADTPQKEAFSVSLSTNRSDILPYEPLIVVVTLKNVSGQLQTLGGDFSDNNFAYVKIRRGLAGEWKAYAVIGVGSGSPPIPAPLTSFQPQEAAQSFIEVHTQPDNTHPFAQPGEYWLRGNVSNKFESEEPLKIVVKKPSAVNMAAFAYLQKVPVYRNFVFKKVFLEYVKAVRETSGEPNQFIAQRTQQLKQFIQRFPRSSYVPWARLALLYVEQVPLIESRYRDLPTVELFNALRKSRIKIEQLALKLPSSIAATAWLHAGDTALHTEDRAAADADFSKAAKLKDPTVITRIAAINSLRKKVILPNLPQPDPAEILSETSRKLKAAGYIPGEWMKDHPQETKEYYTEQKRLLDEMANGKINEKEFFQRRAELMERYVKKYGQPRANQPE